MIDRIENARSELAEKIAKWTENDRHTLVPEISHLGFVRHNHAHEPICGLHEPSVCIIAQGVKQVVVGSDSYEYNPQNYLFTSINLPTISQITSASPERPFLGLKLVLDMNEIASMLLDSNLPALTENSPISGMATGEITFELLDAFLRLLGLLEKPEDIPMLAPIIQKEIYYRLLTGAQAAHLRQVVSSESKSKEIAELIEWLKNHFKPKLSVDELAHRAGMSNSAFHSHFRSMTGLSPLQFMKNLKLNEARHLMISENMDAAAAAFEVGYENPSQFNREYKRTFGNSPKRDNMEIRKKLSLGGDTDPWQR